MTDNDSIANNEPITEILRSLSAGEDGAREQLLNCIYDQLKKIAAYKMANESPGHTLQPTALLNEAYMRLSVDVNMNWRDRQHFLGAAAEAMRRVLIDHARKRHRLKRGGNALRIELNECHLEQESNDERLIALDEALQRLAEVDQTRALVVKLKYFAGLANAEIADTLKLSLRTVERHWTFSKAWLKNEMSKE